MANFQYKTASAGTWTNVPHSAYEGTYDGALDVVYPKPAERGGDGRGCGVVGLPYVHIQSRVMSASGMNFWRTLFAAASSVDAEVWLKARDPRAGSAVSNWVPWTGWLARPKWGQLQVGSGSLDTLYFDVEIMVHEIRVTT